jgi:RimJ/RimL family protein N-acetyltransferase
LGVRGDTSERAGVRIEPWRKGDLPLLQKCLGDPAMMAHLGGPESAEKIAERQTRYEQPDSKQFKIVDEATGEGVGWVGYWERDWRGYQVYEIGWSVLPVFQGRGIAGSATLAAVAIARSERKRWFMHAYPYVDNAPSNAICRKLGFALLGSCEFEYPQGSFMQCHDWRLDLFASRPKSGPPRSADSPPSTLNDDQASN